ncbi:hypothetical protein EVAR_66716_1 [Eumeta japonica]|uniref:Reverse transcriptase domain-containing protein n=1 Tax=Eumeta variegata TaxID=151549 RepID=A0A4C2A420_EUMVA|nr:hypothetical protein EVAR_66716_1 [Eumeta japonica]
MRILLRVADGNVTAVVCMIDDGKESEIKMDEIMKALKRMKLAKAAGFDRASSEMLRNGGGIVASLLYQLFNKCCYLYDMKEYVCGLRMDELPVKYRLYAEEQVILVPSACRLQERR